MCIPVNLNADSGMMPNGNRTEATLVFRFGGSVRLRQGIGVLFGLFRSEANACEGVPEKGAGKGTQSLSRSALEQPEARRQLYGLAAFCIDSSFNSIRYALLHHRFIQHD